ncbi:hypothetical protein [Nostoc sp. FACHB-888]|uniref:hypothetical protein n=1 Tax=Nostoc sp. FACHB-888 TaxID=2692842 RepID=UPI001684E0E6|nr:hypothetical protein [Nostoc sp. FACHB-888]MBD2248419.1 hypothetical protein [Nostoc sp. FACHB-888]
MANKFSCRQIKVLPFLLCLITVTFSCSFLNIVDAQSPKLINSIATIIEDMQPPHEEMPRGVPKSYDWAIKPRVGSKNPKKFKAMTAWGQLYEAVQGNPATNTRVQIKNIKAYYLSKSDGKWYLLQSSTKVEGKAYKEDFSGDMNKTADIRYESDGSVTAKAGNSYNFHFWPANGRATINSDDVRGMFTTVQARLIIDNPKKDDDRSQARYLLSMGGDYWLDLDAKWDNWTTNEDFGIGKFKYVTTEWQAFNMITLPQGQIRENPPPIE